MATSSETSDQNNVKSRRPAESAFKQQRLPAWQPILTAGTVLPTFFVIGIAFIPVGIGLLYFSDEVREHVIDYTYCTKKDEGITCADYIKQTNMSLESKCFCEMEFNLTEDFKSEVFFYYGLSNFYQNHRRYVKSRDDEQLLGRLGRPLSTDCEPFASRTENGTQIPIAPCGAIANSLFNDTLKLYSQDQEKYVPVLRTGIAWNSDKKIKFRNPDTSAYNGSLKAAFANYTKPANWAVNVWELDPNDTENNGFQNEDLIVWMRTAALPTFRKLYRRVDHAQTGFRAGLSKGPYILRIEYNYPVTDFDGTKSFVISTTSLLGGKNPFLGVAYVVVGTLCLLLGIVLLIIHVRCSKRYYPTPSESFFYDIDTRSRSRIAMVPETSETFHASQYNNSSTYNLASSSRGSMLHDNTRSVQENSDLNIEKASPKILEDMPCEEYVVPVPGTSGEKTHVRGKDDDETETEEDNLHVGNSSLVVESTSTAQTQTKHKHSGHRRHKSNSNPENKANLPRDSDTRTDRKDKSHDKTKRKG